MDPTYALRDRPIVAWDEVIFQAHDRVDQHQAEPLKPEDVIAGR